MVVLYSGCTVVAEASALEEMKVVRNSEHSITYLYFNIFCIKTLSV